MYCMLIDKWISFGLANVYILGMGMMNLSFNFFKK